MDGIYEYVDGLLYNVHPLTESFTVEVKVNQLFLLEIIISVRYWGLREKY